MGSTRDLIVRVLLAAERLSAARNGPAACWLVCELIDVGAELDEVEQSALYALLDGAWRGRDGRPDAERRLRVRRAISEAAKAANRRLENDPWRAFARKLVQMVVTAEGTR